MRRGHQAPPARRVRPVTRARLLDAAEAVFFTSGYGATSIDAVAAAAGYTTGAVYSNFGGKADLFLAVLERVAERDVAAIRAALEAASTDEQVLGVLTTAVTGQREQWRARLAATFEFVATCHGRVDLQQRIAAAQRIADEALGELLVAMSRRMGLPEPTDLPMLARAVNALLGGYGARAIIEDYDDLVTEMSRSVVALLTGMAAMAEPAGSAAHA